MIKNKEMLFRISICLNLLLIVVIAWGINKTNFVKEQILLTEVQWNLVELEGLIAQQIENDWSEPNLVTVKMTSVLNGIVIGRRTGGQLGTLSESDNRNLARLESKLKHYPNDELYSLADVRDEDKRNFEELRNVLRETGFGMKIQISSDMDYFMQQIEMLNEKVEYPLN